MIAFNKTYKTNECLSKISSGFNIDLSDYPSIDLAILGREIKHYLLTHSATAALELMALTLYSKPQDEIIVPAFTYVSTANALASKGINLVFADSSTETPHISFEAIQKCLSANTKAVMLVHYGGIAADLEQIIPFCRAHNLDLLEDNAHGVGAMFRNQTLGTFGKMAAFSFHHTKNIHCYSGGLLNFNKPEDFEAAQPYFFKGTNKAAFLAKKVLNYEWVSTGSSFHLNELAAHFLSQQLNLLSEVNAKRLSIFQRYESNLLELKSLGVQMPVYTDFHQHNAHIFYLVLRTEKELKELQSFLLAHDIEAFTHYTPLHLSAFGKRFYKNELPQAERYAKQLLRLPIYPDLTFQDIDRICDLIIRCLKA